MEGPSVNAPARSPPEREEPARDEQMRKLFGTDGVRGTANIHPMTADMALRIGAAVGRYFRRDVSAGHRVVIGKDTRSVGLYV